MKTEQTQTEAPPQAVLMQMIMGFMLSQAIYVAAKLGVADLLKRKPRSISELANETGTDERSLYRVLRALASAAIQAQPCRSGARVDSLRLPSLSPEGFPHPAGVISTCGFPFAQRSPHLTF
jgi:hypothetical protein